MNMAVAVIPDKELSILISFFKKNINTCPCGGSFEYIYENNYEMDWENIIRKCIRCGKKEVFENVRLFINDYRPGRKIEWKLLEGARIFRQPEQKVNQGEYQRKVKREIKQ